MTCVPTCALPISVGVLFARDRRVQVQVHLCDLVEFQLLGRQLLLGVDVDLVLDLRDLGAHGAGADLQPVQPAGQQGLGVQPQQVGGELIGDLRRIVGVGDDVAAAGVALVGQGQGYRLAFAGTVQVGSGGGDG